jgi:quinol monooxygenase YgiN
MIRKSRKGDIMLALIAKIPVKEEKRAEAIEAFKALIAEVAQEEGTLSYTLNVSPNDPNTLVVLERYRDQEALNHHSSTPHFKAFSAKAREFFAGRPEITLLEELASI